ncbi:hypothetical protein DH2020_008149 [Rehmannia glutinosa]|uniref:Protein kinase domain-containing protein n=1 Tax=Rehmannia glutinosa TaxID=99300 RepID=A0ABR0U074_REHGL
MPNGTLSQHLQTEKGSKLPWPVRLTIASETAQAISYLHNSIHPPIYHRDIKSSNILLDYNYKSKVADFGLSRLGLIESSHISTAPQGTPDEINLAAVAVDRIGRGCLDEIIDPFILGGDRDNWTISSVDKVAELAFRCLAFHRDMRPSMMDVAVELEQIRLSKWTYSEMSVTTSNSSSSDYSKKSLKPTVENECQAIQESCKVIRALNQIKITPICWNKPGPTTLKLNIDGATRGLINQAGLGGVLRDYNGNILWAFCGKISCEDSFLAECGALEQGLEHLQQLNIQGFALNLTHNNYWKWQTTLARIRHKMIGTNISLSHTLREGNKVADAMASLGCRRGRRDGSRWQEQEGERAAEGAKAASPAGQEGHRHGGARRGGGPHLTVEDGWGPSD